MANEGYLYTDLLTADCKTPSRQVKPMGISQPHPALGPTAPRTPCCVWCSAIRASQGTTLDPDPRATQSGTNRGPELARVRTSIAHTCVKRGTKSRDKVKKIIDRRSSSSNSHAVLPSPALPRHPRHPRYRSRPQPIRARLIRRPLCRVPAVPRKMYAGQLHGQQ